MEAYRHKNLVYIPFPKHASRSYIHFFANVLGWQRTETYKVNWKDDQVFGHLMDPVKRHINGVVQALTQHELFHLVQSEDFKKLLRTSIFFDQHSYPLTRMLDLDQCYQIEWLPLDHKHVSGEDFTKYFLQGHGIDIDTSAIPKYNQSTPNEKSLRENILQEKEKIMDSLIWILQEDLNLYNKVNIHTRYFEIGNLPWQDISYKKNFVEKYGFEELKNTRFNIEEPT
jgi:hypothetical protein